MPAQTQGSSEPSPAPAAGSCDATSCKDGCCVAGKCFSDHTLDHCATGGVACPAACARGATCAAQGTTFACSASGGPVAANYDVVLVGAKVQLGADGTGSDLPDPYVNDGKFGTLSLPRTNTIDNSLAPMWNAGIGTMPGAGIVGAVVTVEVKDDDSFGGDDLIGTCTHTVTAAEVSAAKVILAKPDCQGAVDSVQFDLKPKP